MIDHTAWPKPGLDRGGRGLILGVLIGLALWALLIAALMFAF